MKLRNIALGPRGVFTLNGIVRFAPGEERDVELSRGEADNLAPYFDVIGEDPRNAVQTTGYEVLERGRGWYVIAKDGEEVTKAFRRDDIDGFADMSEDEQAAFVAENSIGD